MLKFCVQLFLCTIEVLLSVTCLFLDPSIIWYDCFFLSIINFGVFQDVSLVIVSKKMKLKFTKAWMSFLRLPLPLEVYKEVRLLILSGLLFCSDVNAK